MLMNNVLPNPDPISEEKEDFKEKKEGVLLLNDRELWQAFKSGNNSAFILIYERFFENMYSYGLRIHSNEELVKDSIHDVFLDLKKNIKSIGETDSIKFYLFKCLKRRVLRELKDWTNLKDEPVRQDNFAVVFSHEQTLIDKQIDIEKAKKINAAISRLSPRKREAIYYVYYEGMSYHQVSELMRLSDSKTARDLIYKALKCLRESLGFLPVIFSPYLA